jgi:hypothetical protein
MPPVSRSGSRDRVKYRLSLHCNIDAMVFSKHNKAYVSDFGQFLSDLKEKNPTLEQKQYAGRAIWWDKAPIDLDARRREKESRIKQDGYVYQFK